MKVNQLSKSYITCFKSDEQETDHYQVCIDIYIVNPIYKGQVMVNPPLPVENLSFPPVPVGICL